ncbi:MAG: hypothetical protein M1820_004189 [Bogoriella megaspora]|nr:MAG: hypothetical protein M1820_004189 [Bogoriella megaspora]
MSGEDIQAVLRCGQCNKPFDKLGAPKTTKSRTQQIHDASAERRNKVHSSLVESADVESCQKVNGDVDVILNSALDVSDQDFVNLNEEFLNWDDPNVELTDFLFPQTDEEAVQYPYSGSSPLVRPSTSSPGQIMQAQQIISPSIVSIPAEPTRYFRSIAQRPKAKAGTQRIANLILHTLKSYPLMMLRQNALPPFIHPTLISSDSENNCMESLTNCISLVHMISGGVQGSRKLFWKNVRLECERLYEEHFKLNKWELLAALQALSIYILIRLDEGETDHNNLDSLLISTVIVGLVRSFASYLALIDIMQAVSCNMQSVLSNYDYQTSWEDWVFEESKRRLCVVYQVMGMLVYFEPAAMCDLQQWNLILAPLPARKQLWEASDEFAWKVERDSEPGFQTAFGLAANGELIKVEDGQIHCKDPVLLNTPAGATDPPTNTANWEEWCSGMDGFGGLVMLAASLVE